MRDPKVVRENRRKMLDLISFVEGGTDYGTIVGGKQKFTDYADHPRIVGLTTAAGPSTAAGRYQITATTYDALRKKFNFPRSFSPAIQDEMAIRLIQERGALPYVDDGDFWGAINKLSGVPGRSSPIWEGFPGNNSPGQHPRSRAQIDRFLAFGGTGMPTGDEPFTPEETLIMSRVGIPLSRQMADDALSAVKARLAELGPLVDKDREALMADAMQMREDLESSDAAIAQQIQDRPIQEERPTWARAVGSILGGRTAKTMEDERTLRREQIQQQHNDLINLAIDRNKRLADAYMKVGDMVNAAKYTTNALKHAAELKKQEELERLAIQTQGDIDVANVRAQGSGAGTGSGTGKAAASPYMDVGEYGKEISTTFAKFMDKRGNIVNEDKLRASIAQLRHSEHTPLSWMQGLIGLEPGKNAILPWNKKKPFFDTKNKQHREVLNSAAEHLFTQEELDNPETGLKATQRWLGTRLAKAGQLPADTPPAESSGEPTEGDHLMKLRSEAADIVKKLAETRRAAGMPLQEARTQQIKGMIERLNEIKRVLKMYGVDLQFHGEESRGRGVLREPGYDPGISVSTTRKGY